MDDQKFANQLVELIGGKENIRAVGHCSTRLRLTLHDKSKVDEEKIENLEGVKGQFLVENNIKLFLEQDL